MTGYLLVGDFVALLLSRFLCTPSPREATVLNSSSVSPPLTTSGTSFETQGEVYVEVEGNSSIVERVHRPAAHEGAKDLPVTFCSTFVQILL